MSLKDLSARLKNRRGRPADLRALLEGPSAPRPDDPGAASGGEAEPGSERPQALADAAARADLRGLDELDPRAAARLAAARIAHPEIAGRIDRLSVEQQRVVCSEAPAVLVRAQVGSGKTTVLVEKLAWLVAVEGVPLDRIAVLTFTSKAAREIAGRLDRTLGDGTATASSRPLIGTFHGVARALVAAAARRGEGALAPGFTVLDAAARRRLLLELVDAHGLRICYRARVEKRLDAYATGRARFGTMKRDDDVGRLAALYAEEKRRRNLADFDDLITQALEVLPGLPEAARPAWIVVDELQDSDERQIAMIERMAGQGTRLLAVGDPRQAIYAWRGAEPRVFERVRASTDALVLDLTRNFRSSANILALARRMCGDVGGALVATRAAGARVLVRRHHDAFNEGVYLVQRVRELMEAGLAPEDVAVLYRTRDQGVPLREALAAAGLAEADDRRAPAREDPADGWLTGFLAALANPRDERAVAAVVGCERFGFGGLQGGGPDADQAEARAFEAALRGFRAEVADGRADLDTASLVARFDLDRRLVPTSSAWGARRARARRLLDRLGGGDGAAALERLDALVAELADGGPLFPDERGVRGVQLMTLHAAKGLEFRHVVISAVNEGVLPLPAARGSRDARDEERRLFFVGLTRAIESLELSWLANPPGYSGEGRPSSFLDALPAEAMERRDRADGGKAAVAGDAGRGEAHPLAPGDRVRHAQYGEGEVVARENGVVRCRFDRFGERAFSEFFCALERL